MKTKTILLLIFMLLILILIIQNSKVITFKIFFWQIQMSGIIMFLLILIFGIILGYILAKILSKNYKVKKEED